MANNWTNLSQVIIVAVDSNAIYAYKLWLAVFLVLCSVGALANLLLFGIIVSSPQLRTGAGILIAHILLIYAGLGAVHYPVFGFILYAKRIWLWTIPNWWCNYVTFFQLGFNFAANWADACIALNRLIGVFLPHYYKQWARPNVLKANVVFVLVVWVVLALQPCFGINGVYIMTAAGSCSYVPIGKNAAVLFTLGIYFPLAFIGVGYTALFMKIGCTKILKYFRVVPAGSVPNRVLKNRIALARALFVSFLWYCACYLPGPMLANFALEFYYSSPLIFLWVRTIFACGSALTPFVLLALNAKYRQRFVHIMRKIFGCVVKRTEEQTSKTNPGRSTRARSSNNNNATD